MFQFLNASIFLAESNIDFFSKSANETQGNFLEVIAKRFKNILGNLNVQMFLLSIDDRTPI